MKQKIIFQRNQFLMVHALAIFFGAMFVANAQDASLQGSVTERGIPVPFANVFLAGTPFGTAADEEGNYLIENVPSGKYILKVTVLGYQPFTKKISLSLNEIKTLTINMTASSEQLEETVVTGTLKAVSRSESPVSGRGL